MPTHALTQLRLSSFGPIGEADLELSPQVNVVIGDNNTGKSQLLRVLYTSTAMLSPTAPRARDVSTKTAREQEIARKLVGVFRPDSLGRLATRAQGRSRAEVKVKVEGVAAPFAYEFASNASSAVKISSYPDRANLEAPVFLPAHEILSIVSGLASLYDAFEVPFDETWRDTAELLARPSLRGRPGRELEEIMAPLNNLLGGRVSNEGKGRFYLQQSGGGRFEAPLMSEGMRKFGMLQVLVANGVLREKGYLFWDEPEANLNPASVRVLAPLIAGLARRGTQVFLATHSLFLLRELQMLDEVGGADIRFIGLVRGDDGLVRAQVVDDLDELPVITALDAELEQSGRYLYR